MLLTLAAAGLYQDGDARLVAHDFKGKLTICAVAADVIRIDYIPAGNPAFPTEVLDPRGSLRRAKPLGEVVGENERARLIVGSLRVNVAFGLINVDVASGQADAKHLTIDRSDLATGGLSIHYAPGQNLYGLRGNGIGGPRRNPGVGIQRNDGATVKAGSQGDGGAPFAFTTSWGVLVDSVDGTFKNDPGHLTFSGGSRKDVEAYIVLGPPKRTIEVATDITGHPPMPPKWSLGFMNSQWKTDQATVTGIIDGYRSRQIPIDAFIFDFDFKAWGEDNYGEWRWNSTDGPGNVGATKYPDGASGKFAAQMAAKGIKLAGIMKPRILVKNADGSTMMAAAEADAHGWWMPGKKPYTDYFSHRPANDLDFSNPACRAWYWKHAKGLFDTGIVGWWNDEADDGFDSLGFFHMQESLYEGQRSASNLRVWSINRNFYLGAQRFAFGTWSGDIRTGFDNMADQRTRMLATLDLAQPHWTMDTGGFNGHPDSENYARWMEFASVVPIMRVHSTYGELRQPWVYGPVAEAAATRAIQWRYSMIPSLYSWEHGAHETGVGIVRPMFWEFPDDPQCANEATEWMLGGQLLVSPVAAKHATMQTVYLPAGSSWKDYHTEQAYKGGQTIQVPVDPETWLDLPMFVRSGTILATQPPSQYVGDHPVDQITLDVWPPEPGRTGRFTVYDDDGLTYNYERGAFFTQEVTTKSVGAGVEIDFSAPKGRYRTPIKTYRVRLHRIPFATKLFAGVLVKDMGNDSKAYTVIIPAGRAGSLRGDASPERGLQSATASRNSFRFAYP